MEHKVGGFTLMELMIAILIVGILVGVAIPKYLQAVDKSKFSSLQPITRKVQTIQEQYYLSNNRYAEELEDLDISVTGEMNGAVGKSGEGLIIQLGNEEEYKYVSGEKEEFNNRYIAYQVHSENFGGDTHCEAKQGDNRADKLCKAIGGEYIGEHGEWIAYRLTGNSSGSFNKECSGTPETEGSCSCGTRTRSASCNEKSGEYEYGEWSECPTQPVREQACTSGEGTQTREVTCKENSWVTGEWDSSNCKKAGGTYSGSGNFCGTGNSSKTSCDGYTFEDGAQCTAYGGCNNNIFLGNSNIWTSCNAESSNSCNDGTFIGHSALCSDGSAAANTNMCVGGTYSEGALCRAYYGIEVCSGAIYQTGSRCEGSNATGCTNNTFKTGTYCVAKKAGACSNNTYEGTACCSAASTGLCPSGSPKCSSSHTWDGTYW